MTVYLVAGAEGCGRTTFIKNLLLSNGFSELPYVSMNEHINYVDKSITSPVERNRVANAECKRIIINLIKAKKSFIMESTLYSKDDFPGLQALKQSGCAIRAVYLATSRPAINERRLKKRADATRSSFQSKDIGDHYRRSMKNLKNLMEISDEIMVYDVSDTEPQKVYYKSAGGEEWLDKRYLEISWVKEFIEPYIAIK